MGGSRSGVELMGQGHSPEEACRATVERIVHRDPAAAKAVQVGFLALGRDGSYGAYALQDGFTFSVKSGSTEQIIPAKHHF